MDDFQTICLFNLNLGFNFLSRFVESAGAELHRMQLAKQYQTTSFQIRTYEQFYD